jgi:hypothetical protein
MNDEKTTMCNEIEPLLSEYLKGGLDEETSRKIENHLESCRECSLLIDGLESKAFLGGSSAPAYEVKKIEASFMRRVVGRIFTIGLVAFAAWYILFYIVLPIAFNKSIFEKQGQSRYAVNDLIQFTIPAARIKNVPNPGKMGVANIYQYAEFERRQTGGFTKSGKIDLAIPVYLGNSDLKLDWSQDGQGNDITFNYPQTKDETSMNTQWGKLEKIQDGTKAFVALYFTDPITAGEMENILATANSEDYCTWFAIETGKQDMHKFYGRAFYNVEWGFPMSLQLTPATANKITKDKSGRSVSMSYSNREHDVNAVAGKFKKEMKDFEKYSKILGVEEFTKELSDVNKYLASNELRIKGTILSAPTSDLLRLKGNPKIARMDLLKIDFDY